MKIFAVYTNVELTKQPPWFDEFRQKFDQPWDLHVTLKQPCFVEEGSINDLKQQLSQHFSAGQAGSNTLSVCFDGIVTGDKDQDGVTIMLRVKDSKELIDLQKDLLSVIPKYDYVKPHHQAYEQNFDPHITIGRDLSDQQYAEASEYLRSGCSCGGIIQRIVLAVVNQDTVEEGTNPDNQTIYSL